MSLMGKGRLPPTLLCNQRAGPEYTVRCNITGVNIKQYNVKGEREGEGAGKR